MARARNIKPGFFVNEDIAECEPMARLLFISLWMLADREGRLENRPKKIKMQSFPYDDCNIDDLLAQLSKKSFIFIYTAGNSSIIQINNWSKHQNPHHKEVESELPRFDKSMHELTTTQSKIEHDSNTVCDGYMPLSNTIRDRIFARDLAICNYCKSRENLEIDHIIPISKGGNSNDENLQVLCKNCNTLKSNNIVNQPSSIFQGRVMLESCLSQDKIMKNASCSTDSLNLIPDTGLLIADSSQQVAPAPSAPRKAIGSRLPNDWKPSSDYWNEAILIKPDLTREWFLEIAHGFKDYWISKTGKDATKADWLATWRNWLRREVKNGKSGFGVNGKKSYGEQRAELFEAVTNFDRATDF